MDSYDFSTRFIFAHRLIYNPYSECIYLFLFSFAFNELENMFLMNMYKDYHSMTDDKS